MNNGEQFFNTSAVASSRSLRFNSSDSAYLSRTPASSGNRKTWTWAGWVKRSASATNVLFGTGVGTVDAFDFSTDSLQVYFNNTSSGILKTTAVFRDFSAWYHIVLALDTTQAASTNRVRLYVNGVEQTTFSTATYPAQNYDSSLNNNVATYIGDRGAGLQSFDGYLADIHFIDGQALDPTSFGEFDDNGIWQPIAYSGSYGTNGFHLDFADNSTAAALGTDSGNGNTWTVNNISVAAGADNDSLVDVPTNGTETDTGVGGEVRGNYCTANPLDKHGSITLRNGNLSASTSEANWRSFRSTIGMSSGKWYWEVLVTASHTEHSHGIGLASSDLSARVGVAAGSYAYLYTGTLQGGSSTGSADGYGATGVIVSFAFNADTGRLDLYRNGVLQSGFFSGLPAGTYFPMSSLYGSGVADLNFGQRPFAYTAPSGYKSLCTINLPAPTIEDGSTAMDVSLYTGNSSTKTISDLNLSPDLVWIKTRSAAVSHALQDIVRGTNKVLYSNSTGTEDTYTAALTSFNSDGFTLGAQSLVNNNTSTYVAWCWDAGSSTVSNDAGSITSQVRANASAGFSIVTYTGNSTVGATVGHGLGVAPQLIIVKARNNVSGGYWQVYHQAIGNTKYLELNTTIAANTSSNRWNNTTPSSSVFTLGSDSDLNGSLNYVAYCFAPVEGYSAFGSYTGNGSTDGPFVYTGFRPRWIMLKNADAVWNWQLRDTSRDPINPAQQRLYPNTNDSETTNDPVDILSNGFKLRVSGGDYNASTQKYVYAAFAENPFALNARAR
jgi:hypothetical protein